MANTADDAAGTDAFSRLYKLTEFNNLLIKLGGWSRFQKFQGLLLFVAAVPQAWYTYAPAFAAAKPKPDQVFIQDWRKQNFVEQGKTVLAKRRGIIRPKHPLSPRYGSLV